MRSRREIREELEAEQAKTAPNLERMAALSDELEAARRVWRRRRKDTAGRAAAPPRPVREPEPADPDEAARATWPPELRARLQRSEFSRVIDSGSPVGDPDGWGVRSDLRRR
ncbi:hypothetical protein ACIQAC_37500 [Streptomyces sp. NPDC088387]|uniref:hypothetical protein n=1 Tax=Streptomyces sp. NPDC088387 TaxID=3365859 RepID=UPI00381D7A8B